eukprot:COSAG01_NODE_7825_length_3040_cov_10.843251_4_plen_134_part_01
MLLLQPRVRLLGGGRSPSLHQRAIASHLLQSAGQRARRRRAVRHRQSAATRSRRPRLPAVSPGAAAERAGGLHGAPQAVGRGAAGLELLRRPRGKGGRPLPGGLVGPGQRVQRRAALRRPSRGRGVSIDYFLTR